MSRTNKKKICVSGIVNVIFHSPGVGPLETVEMKVLRLCRAQARLWEKVAWQCRAEP